MFSFLVILYKQNFFFTYRGEKLIDFLLQLCCWKINKHFTRENFIISCQLQVIALYFWFLCITLHSDKQLNQDCYSSFDTCQSKSSWQVHCRNRQTFKKQKTNIILQPYYPASINWHESFYNLVAAEKYIYLNISWNVLL